MPQYREASRFGELAIKCLPRFGQSARCRTLIVVTLFSMHLKRPYNHCLDHALEAYKSGMQVGDSNFSFCSTSAYLYLYMCAGLPLVSVDTWSSSRFRQYCAHISCNNNIFVKESIAQGLSFVCLPNVRVWEYYVLSTCLSASPIRSQSYWRESANYRAKRGCDESSRVSRCMPTSCS